MFGKRHLFRRWLAFFGVTLMVGVGLAMAQPVAADSHMGVVNSAALNVRSGPGVGYAPTAVVYQGYAITLLERNNSGTWVKIRTTIGVEGWVNSTLISTSADMSTLPVTSLPTLEALVLVTPIHANIRAGDSLEYVVIGTVSKDQKLALLGRNFNSAWAYMRVVSTGQQGWINIDNITPNDISAYPMVVTPPLTANNSAAAAKAAADTAASTGSSALVVAGNLNVRRGDGVSYQIIGSVTGNTAVTILARNSSNTWAYIRLPNGQEGWVNASFLRYDSGISNLPVRAGDGTTTASTTADIATITTTTSTPTGVVTVNTSILSVYAGPGTNYNSFAQVFQGQNLISVGRSADSAWVKVQDATGSQGWVLASSVTSSTPIASMTVVN